MDLTAFFTCFLGFRASREERRQGEGNKVERQMGFSWKNNAKKGGFLAIFGLNLEKEGLFGEGFWWNCVGIMEDLGRIRLKTLTTIPRESTAGQAVTKEHQGK